MFGRARQNAIKGRLKNNLRDQSGSQAIFPDSTAAANE
jgi:hypothetical protein